jgi:hypothetical protein
MKAGRLIHVQVVAASQLVAGELTDGASGVVCSSLILRPSSLPVLLSAGSHHFTQTEGSAAL